MIDPTEELRWEILSVFAENVQTVTLEMGKGVETERHDQPRPNVGEVPWVEIEIKIYLDHRRAGFLKRPHGFFHDASNLGLNREDSEIG
jgi:hypothetical protein